MQKSYRLIEKHTKNKCHYPLGSFFLFLSKEIDVQRTKSTLLFSKCRSARTTTKYSSEPNTMIAFKKHKCSTDKIYCDTIACQQGYFSGISWHFAEVACLSLFSSEKWSETKPVLIVYNISFHLVLRKKNVLQNSQIKSEQFWCIIIHLCHTHKVRISVVCLLFVALKVIHWFNVRPEAFLY